MFLSSFLVIIIVTCFLLFLKKERKKFVMYKQIPAEPGSIPVFGNLYLALFGDRIARMDAFKRFGRYAIEQGGLSSFWLGPSYFVVIVDAAIVEIMLKKFLEKDDIMNITHELLGYGSIFAPVNIWRPRRKVIAPTFSMKNINEFVEIFSQQSSIMVGLLKKAAGKGPFSVWKHLTTYTLDSVCETALGVKVGGQQNLDHPFLRAFEQYCHSLAGRIMHPPIAQRVCNFLPIFKEHTKNIFFMWDFVDAIITKKRKEILEREEKKQCNSNESNVKPFQKTFLDLYIESSGGSSGFTCLELREEALVLLLAGTDTSAIGASFTCLLLARHPEVQEKAYKEIREVLGDAKGPITSADLYKLKYLEAVIKESMRLYPPVPIIVRKIDADFQLPSGQILVKGTALVIDIWAIHRNPAHWGDDAEQFNPERFLGSAQIHPAAYLPFSLGPRSCLGSQYAMLSMKTAMAKLIRHYRLHPATPVQDKNEPLRVQFSIMMKHADNFELQLEART